MNSYIQFTERPIEALHLPLGSGSSRGPVRISDLEDRMKDQDEAIVDFKVFDATERLVCAGRYLGEERDRDGVLEKVRIHAENVDDVDPIRLVYEDGANYVFHPDGNYIALET